MSFHSAEFRKERESPGRVGQGLRRFGEKAQPVFQAAFRVREHERVWGDQGALRCLSPRSGQGFLHLKFARTRENQFVLGQHSGPFASVPELVLHYGSRPLPVQGAEHLALLYPVVAQTP